MKITLKLFASLASHLPPEARDSHRIDLEVEPGATVVDVVRRHRVPETMCAIVLVDGRWVPRPERATRVLREGEVLSIWPPVAGGAAPFTRSLEMGLSREEFFRLLPFALPVFEAEGDLVRWNERDGRGTIRLLALPNHHVARGVSRDALLVPRHQVDITIEGCSDADGEAFMTRFHRAFLRGGG